MYQFFKKYEKHQKKLLAIFSVGLMIVFALPAMIQNSGRGDSVAATVLGSNVMASNFQSAGHEWDFLSRDLFVPDFQTKSMIRAASLLGRDFDMSDYLQGEITQHPHLFYLLLEEARHFGASVDPDALREREAMARTVDASGMLTAIPAQNQASSNQAIYDVMVINDMMTRVAGLPKASVPQVQHLLAGDDGVSLNVVEFPAKDYLSKAPKPTPAEINAQYEKYKNADASVNPYGFSYQVPNRVKIEYLEINREQVRAAIAPTIDEIQARKYYHLHEESFTTRPSTAAPGFGPGLGLDSSGAATTRPFEAVREEIYSTLVKNDTDAKMDLLAQNISAEMSDDFAAFQAAVYPQGQPPATGPATQVVQAPTTQPMPASSVGVPYNSPDYLRDLAPHIKQLDAIQPRVTQPVPWLSPDGLGALDGIGQASLPPKMPESMADLNEALMSGVPFSSYALRYVRPLATREALARQQPRVLSLLEPSQILSDDAGNRYIFRVTAAEPAHAPALVDVFPQVERDATKLAAIKLAHEAAQKLIADIGQHHLKHLAAEHKLPMTTTGIFFGGQQESLLKAVPHDLISDDDASAFTAGAYSLLTDGGAGADSNHPVGIIELGHSGKVLLAEVNEVEGHWRGEQGISVGEFVMAYGQPPQKYYRRFRGIVPIERMGLLQQWLSWDAVAARMQYKQVGEKHGP